MVFAVIIIDTWADSTNLSYQGRQPVWEKFLSPSHYYIDGITMPKKTVKTKMDKRGRIVIPKEIRERFQAEFFEVKVEGATISLIPLKDPLTTLQQTLSKSSTKSIDELAENIAVQEVKNADH